MNKCLNLSYNGISCPYALSPNSPLPCCGSPEQCADYRYEIGEFSPANPNVVIKASSFKKQSIGRTKRKKAKAEIVTVKSILYGVDVHEE